MSSTPTKGFTLIELLVVIAIIGVLSSVVLASLDDVRSSARDTQRTADIRAVITAIEMYRNNSGSYPMPPAIPNQNTVQPDCGGSGWCLSTITQLLVDRGHLSMIPADPLHNNTTANYRYCGSGARYTIIRYKEAIGGWCVPLQQLPAPHSGCGTPPYMWNSYPQC